MEIYDRKRMHFLDEYRGFVIILMVLYHALFDLNELFYVEIPFFWSDFMRWVVYFIGGSFIFISGVSCRLSKNNLKRGIICLGFATMLYIISALFIPSQIIRFGILHLLGFSMVLFGLLKKGFDKISPFWGAVVCFLLFLFIFDLPRGYIGLFGLKLFSLPAKLYDLGFLFWLGFPARDFYSGDYYPLLPWVALFLFGSFMGEIFKSQEKFSWLYKKRLQPLAVVGKHSMIIYLLHQPLIYALLWGFFYIKG